MSAGHKAQVLRLGPPADSRGDIFAPGCLKAATVPVTLDFDPSAVIGYAHVAEDGSAEIHMSNVAGSLEGASIGFRVLRDRWEGDSLHVVEEIEPVTIGAKVSNRGVEMQECQTCHVSRLVQVRSIEDTFWCERCKAWKPCAPKKAGQP